MSAPGLLELLEAGSRGTSVVRVRDAQGQLVETSWAQLWRESETVAGRIAQHVEPGGTVATVLEASAACVVTIAGVLRSGRRLASFPTRARAMGAEAHAEQVGRLCGVVEAQLLVCEPASVADVPGLPPRLTFGELPGGPAGSGDEDGMLIQCSSGSTADPKCVLLPLDRIAANTTGVNHKLDITDDSTMYSWLPLSHDMGLIGGLLSTWVAGADLELVTPSRFIGAPGSWMAGCAERHATHTWGPNFGYALAARSAGRMSGSLSSMRVCVSGSEPIDANVLRAFHTAMEPFGLSELAITGGYGLAENTLGVSGTEPDKMWVTSRVDGEALAAGRWEPVSADGREMVSAGTLFRDTEVRIVPIDSGGDGVVGEIQIASPSVLAGFIGRDLDLAEGRFLRTGDLGALIDGELFVIGRTDDLLIIGGRNLYATELETAAAAHPAMRAGSVVAIPAGAGHFAVVAEHARDATAEQMADAQTWVRRTLVSQFGASPSDVTLLPPGALPKTPSGKLARKRTEAMYEAGELVE